MTADTQTILARLAKLERQNRRMKLAGVSVLVLVGAGLLMWPTTTKKAPKVITAEKFVVVDKDGKNRIIRDIPSGTPGPWLIGKDGTGSRDNMIP